MKADNIKNINDLKRTVVEFLLRLKRDSKKLKQTIFLMINAKLVFGYDVKDNCWLLNGEDWEPSVEEVIDTVDNYDYIPLETWKNALNDYEEYVKNTEEELAMGQ